MATEIPNVPAASDAVQSNATNLPDTPAEPPKPDATPTDANSKDFNAAEFVAQLDPDEIFETKLPDINAELIELVIKLHSILILYLNANAVTETEEKLIRDEFKQFLTEFVGKFVEEKLDEIENQTPEEIAKFEDTFLINTLPCNVFDIIEDVRFCNKNYLF